MLRPAPIMFLSAVCSIRLQFAKIKLLAEGVVSEPFGGSEVSEVSGNVEFAKAELEKGREVIEAALEGARLRLRPILMTSSAFILGSAPLWIASGAGAESRRILGTVVIVGMLTATCIAIFLIPLTFYLVEKFTMRFSRKHGPEIGSPTREPTAGDW
jgi:hypothetical protein